ncbi:glycoside hydrolase [Ramicandelaber brevisporus]|nr:glycoside hydrolase [Ramicandelaber brevisporus]
MLRYTSCGWLFVATALLWPPLCIANILSNRQAATLAQQHPAVTLADLNVLSASAPPFPTASNPLAPKSLLALPSGSPKPTNKWWLNLVLGEGGNPITAYPYLISALPNGIAFGYPQQVVTDKAVIMPFQRDWTITAAEPVASRAVVAYDDLGATMNWYGTSGDIRLQSYFVKGSPFVSVQMSAATPLFKTAHSITSMDGPHFLPGSIGTRTMVTLNNTQTWAIYALTGGSGSLATLQQFNSSAIAVPSGPFTGVFRFALAPPSAPVPAVRLPINTNRIVAADIPPSAATPLPPPSRDAVTALDRAAGVLPVAANVDISFPSDTTGQIEYTYQTVSPPVATDFYQHITLALPHHMPALVSPSYEPALNNYRCIKGQMTAVKGNKLILKETLPASPSAAATATGKVDRNGEGSPLSWFGRFPVDERDRDRLLLLVQQDIARTESEPIKSTDAYMFGKQLARTARLALIAEDAGAPSSVVQKAVSIAKQQFEPWLRGTNVDSLQYDSTWGGLVPRQALADPGADYGSGAYNDHHFHYGYFAYAAAVIGKYDRSWLQTNRDAVTAMLRDYANPSHSDPYFPFVRHKDMFDYHSWASGLVDFGDSRNQESISESVNGYYAAYLLANVLPRDSPSADLARFELLMLQMELRAAHAYWQMPSRADSSMPQIYPPEFTRHRTVGIVWGSKVDYATWFGANPEYIHGIQMLPYTPASSLLIQPQWAADQNKVLEDRLASGSVAQPWAEILIMAQATFDPQGARSRLAQITDHDNGNSASNALYWVSTCCR